MKDFFNELRRRHVFRIGIAYAVVGWLLAQGAAIFLPNFGAPPWVMPVFLGLIVAGFPVALVLAWAFESTPDGVKRTAKEKESASESKAEAPKAIADTPSIAVLPFADMSPDKDQEYFSDGLSEELLNKLARIKGLQVAGRTSSFHFKGMNEDIRSIAEQLGVAHVLEGSVRKAGDQVRITAQLIKAADGYHLWSKTYDRKLDDIFAIQDEIAEAVATALEVTLGVGQFGSLPGMTRNAEAYDEYLKGTAIYQQYAPETYLRAIEHMQRAITIDPSFATAQVMLSEIYLSGASIFPDRSQEWHRRAEDVLEQARKVCPESPLVLTASARQAMNHRQWAEAGEFYFEKMPALDEKYGADIQSKYQTGQFLMRVGRIREALGYLEAARSADPLNSFITPYLADVHTDVGNISAGLAEYERGVGEGGFQLAIRGSGLVAALATHDRALIDKWAVLSFEATLGPFNINKIMYELIDDSAAALAEIRRLMTTPPTDKDSLSSMVLAYWAAYYGDPELALALTRKTLESPDLVVQVFTVWRPVFKDMRKLPGFKDLMRDVGLVDYWKKYGWGDLCHPISSDTGGDDDFECE